MRKTAMSAATLKLRLYKQYVRKMNMAVQAADSSREKDISWERASDQITHIQLWCVGRPEHIPDIGSSVLYVKSMHSSGRARQIQRSFSVPRQTTHHRPVIVALKVN